MTDAMRCNVIQYIPFDLSSTAPIAIPVTVASLAPDAAADYTATSSIHGGGGGGGGSGAAIASTASSSAGGLLDAAATVAVQNTVQLEAAAFAMLRSLEVSALNLLLLLIADCILSSLLLPL